MTAKALQDPTYNSTGWNTPLNANFVNIDAAFGGVVQSFNLSSVSGNINVSGTVYTGSYPGNTPSYIPLVFSLTGTLTANVTLTIPSGVGGRWLVNNSTTGAYTVTIASGGGGASITATSGGITDCYADGTNILAIGVNTVPPGTIFAYAAAAAPSGYLLCYGQSVSTVTYANLFAAIGHTWGGSGSNFNIPDFRGTALVGPDNMGGTAAGVLTGLVLAGRAGAQAITLSTAQIPPHTHVDAGHAHGVYDPGHAHGGVIVPGGAFGGSAPPYLPLSAGNTAVNGTGISIASGYANIQNTGGGTSHSNVQPTLGVNIIIKY